MGDQKNTNVRRKPKELNIEIGKRCQKARETAGYTQGQLAEQIGVSTQFLSDAERGITGMSVSTIVKLCRILNISSDYLLLGQKESEESGEALSIFTRMKRLTPQEFEMVEAVANIMMKSFHIYE